MSRPTVRLILTSFLLGVLLMKPAGAAPAWRNDFDDACAKTTEAMTLTPDELRGLMEKCDRVEKAIAAEEETVRKVYLKRVQMCRNLYRYVLEAKEQQDKGKK